MNKELITDKQAISVMVLFISGSTLMFDTAQAAGEDMWLAIILALIAVLIFSVVYGRILTLFPGKNLFQICIAVFGKWMGRVFCLLYVFFSLHLASLVLVDYAEFMAIIALNGTPKIVSMICIMLLVLWILKEGIITLGRWCEFFAVVTFIIVFISVLLFIPHMDINNVRPFLHKGISPVMSVALDSFSFPFAETVIFMGVFSSFKNEKSSYRIYRKGLAIGAVLVFVSSVTHMLVLGPEEMKRLYFPPYTAFRIIDIKNFFTRIEIIIAVGFLIGGFIKIAVCLLICGKGICEIVNIGRYKIIITPICILTIIIATSDFSSIMELLEWDITVWKWWAMFYQIILPIIILIFAEIEVRKGRKRLVV